MYKLLPSKDEGLLFFGLDGETGERYGQIGFLRADFGKNGRDFYSTWIDRQVHLKSCWFKAEFDDVIDSLRNDGDKPPFASRENLAALCSATPGKELTARGNGYMIRTLNYSYYFRCFPYPQTYDVYCFAYDNGYLLPELADKNDLPDGFIGRNTEEKYNHD
jgi:hypothetical protein